MAYEIKITLIKPIKTQKHMPSSKSKMPVK